VSTAGFSKRERDPPYFLAQFGGISICGKSFLQRIFRSESAFCEAALFKNL